MPIDYIDLSQDMTCMIRSTKNPKLYLHADDDTLIFKKREYSTDSDAVFKLSLVKDTIYNIQLSKKPDLYVTKKNKKLILDEKSNKKKSNIKFSLTPSTSNPSLNTVFFSSKKSNEAAVVKPNKKWELNANGKAELFELVDYPSSEKVEPIEEVHWLKIAENLKDIAIGGSSILWGITQSNQLARYNLKTGEWIETEQLEEFATPKQIEVAADGTVMVRAIYQGESTATATDSNGIVTTLIPDPKYLAYKYLNFQDNLFNYDSDNTFYQGHFKSDRWIQISGVDIMQISLGSLAYVYYLDAENYLHYAREITGIQAVKINSIHPNTEFKFKDIGVGRDGTIVGIAMDGTLQYIHHDIGYDTASSFVISNQKFKAITVGSAGQIMGITDSNTIMIHVGGRTFFREEKKERLYDEVKKQWVKKSIKGQLLKIDYDENNDCYVVAKQGKVFRTYRRVNRSRY